LLGQNAGVSSANLAVSVGADHPVEALFRALLSSSLRLSIRLQLPADAVLISRRHWPSALLITRLSAISKPAPSSDRMHC
jgi:hypothetical protein